MEGKTASGSTTPECKYLLSFVLVILVCILLSLVILIIVSYKTRLLGWQQQETQNPTIKLESNDKTTVHLDSDGKSSHNETGLRMWTRPFLEERGTQIMEEPTEMSTSGNVSLDLRSCSSTLSLHEYSDEGMTRSRDPPQRANDSEERFCHVIRCYDAFAENVHELSFVRGCLIANEELHVIVSDSRNLDECYDRVMNIMPSDVREDTVIVEPETPQV